MSYKFQVNLQGEDCENNEAENCFNAEDEMEKFERDNRSNAIFEVTGKECEIKRNYYETCGAVRATETQKKIWLGKYLLIEIKVSIMT